uniref:Nicotinic acetylcholine receptor subunit n=1 Tax=Ciona intestinalis TaxID=7719 RepID=E7FIZ1_CIOIN|nr:nicotinic acetylcholine receptor subunit [Ciona intestinalis]
MSYRYIAVMKLLILLVLIVEYAQAVTDPEIPIYEYETQLANKLVHDGKRYSPLSRPVVRFSDAVVVKFGLGLVQIVELSEKSEVLVTRLWLKMEWKDHDIIWKPQEYGGLDNFRLRTDLIWTPDIALYNNAESSFNIPLDNLATIYYNGTVTWEGPVLFRTSCFIDVSYFPFDRQNCSLKLGPWSHSTDQVDMEMALKIPNHPNLGAIDMSRFWKSAEWQLQGTYGVKSSRQYRSTADEYFTDITYFIVLRRLPLYYAVNVMVPCFQISAITVMVFFLPVGSMEKITLCISVLVALTVFLILIIDIVPSTSLVVPLLGQYLLLTTIFVTLSIAVSIITVNMYYRHPKCHPMPPMIRRIFVEILPKYLFSSSPIKGRLPRKDNSIKRNTSYKHYYSLVATNPSTNKRYCFGKILERSLARIHHRDKLETGCMNLHPNGAERLQLSGYYSKHMTHNVMMNTHMDRQLIRINKSIENLIYICEKQQKEAEEKKLKDEWKLVSSLVDRIFLIVYVIINIGIVVLLIVYRFTDEEFVYPDDV